MQQDEIYSFTRRMEQLYRSGNTQVAKYVSHSLSETVQTVYAYLNSKHISGEKDSLGRDKPFFNICIAARNIWFRATDRDRKHIIIRESDSDHVITAFIATAKLQEWMRRERFGVFLNDWGLTLAGFGSAISKWVESDGKLIPTVVPWSKMICDAVDFDNNPKIELFEFTPDQLRAKTEYDQDVVESLIEACTVRMNINGEVVDMKPDYIKIYEVHGIFPLSYLTGKINDRKKYARQMQALAYNKVSGKRGKYDNFCLYKGKESKDPYRKDDLIKEDGRTLAIGAVEHLFQAQWMVNHEAKAIKDQLDIASKLMFQTTDANFLGTNVLTAIQNGQVLITEENKELKAVPNGSHDITALQNYMSQWKAVGQEINGIADAMLAVNQKAGTSWKLNNQNLQEGMALFQIMKQNKDLAIEDMLQQWIIPHIKRQLNDSKQIVATLEAHHIKRIDSIYVPQEAIKRYNKKVIDHVLKNGTRPTGIDLQQEMKQVQDEQNQNGNTRYFKPSEIGKKTWKMIIKDMEWEVYSENDENTDSDAQLETLNTALQIVMNPNYATNPQAQMIVGRILRLTQGFSPLELSTTPPPQPQQETMPAQP